MVLGIVGGLYKLLSPLILIIQAGMQNNRRKEIHLQHQTNTIKHHTHAQLQPRSNRLMGSPFKNAAPHSIQKNNKLSANKLFAKAHQITNGETYLTQTKSSQPQRQKTRSSSKQCSDCTHSKKTKSLGIGLQYNIKIGGETEGHTLSQIIQKYGMDGIGNEDLSSIHQNTNDSLDTTANTSLIELLVKS